MDKKFDIGDRVVHPQHGVGIVADVEEKQFEPHTFRTYYVVSIPATTLWVPVDLSPSGLRKLCLKSELEHCRQVLQSAPLVLTPDRGMLSGLANRLNQGTIFAQCEVLRDLTAHGWHKSLFGPIADFRRTIFGVLCQEWAAVEEVSQAEASQEITALLNKGKAVYEH